MKLSKSGEKQYVDAVEDGTDIIDEDPFDGFGFDGRGSVDLAFAYALLYLFFGQSAQYLFFHGFLLKNFAAMITVFNSVV